MMPFTSFNSDPCAYKWVNRFYNLKSSEGILSYKKHCSPILIVSVELREFTYTTEFLYVYYTLVLIITQEILSLFFYLIFIINLIGYKLFKSIINIILVFDKNMLLYKVS